MQALFNTAWQSIDVPSGGIDTNEHWSRPWIYQQGSLTAALSAHCRGKFNVQVLMHRFESAIPEAANALCIDPVQPVLHREVLLCDDRTPLVFACSCLPEIALTGRFAPLRELGAKPLGHWLFSQPALIRQAMSQACLSSSEPLFSRLSSIMELPVQLPGRKTLFTGAAAPFLVSEFFLPALETYRDCAAHPE